MISSIQAFGWTRKVHSLTTVNEMNDSKEGHYWYAVLSSQEKIACCSVSQCTFVGVCKQIVQLKGGGTYI